MKLSQAALQLYTLRDHCRDATEFTETVRKVRRIGYTAVQLSGIGPISASELAAICRDEGLTICATHEPSDVILREPERCIDRLMTLGCRLTAYPSPRGYDLTNPASVAALARQLDAAGARLREAGITLGYHNHGFEFLPFGDGTVLDYLFAQTDPLHLVAELDTFWVHYGGHNVVDWCHRMSGRMPFIHLKDYGINAENRHEYREIGAGSLPFRDIITVAEASGCEWFIVEQDETPGDPFASVQQSFDYIQSHLVD